MSIIRSNISGYKESVFFLRMQIAQLVTKIKIPIRADGSIEYILSYNNKVSINKIYKYKAIIKILNKCLRYINTLSQTNPEIIIEKVILSKRSFKLCYKNK